MRRIAGISALLLVACMPLTAQQPEQGIYPGITYDSDILGSVNLTTGALAIKHLVLKLPQAKGFSVGDLSLQYNSTVWVLTSPGCDPSQGPCDNEWLPMGGGPVTPVISLGVAS
jgi:hypothetical protein